MNATFHSFKKSGKWYASGRGIWPPAMNKTFGNRERRELIASANNNAFPGISSKGSEFILVVIPDDDTPDSWPIMLIVEVD